MVALPPIASSFRSLACRSSTPGSRIAGRVAAVIRRKNAEIDTAAERRTRYVERRSPLRDLEVRASARPDDQGGTCRARIRTDNAPRFDRSTPNDKGNRPSRRHREASRHFEPLRRSVRLHGTITADLVRQPRRPVQCGRLRRVPCVAALVVPLADVVRSVQRDGRRIG